MCKKMFLNTFGLKEWCVLNWAKMSVSGMHTSQVEKISTQQMPGPSSAAKNISKRSFLDSFLLSLQKLPSHYCRQSTSKLYLEPMWGSVSQLYEEYKKQCVQNGTECVSRYTFSSVMTEKNISLYAPKKDQCDICSQFKMKNIEEDEWQRHIDKKNRARAEKEKDKKEAEEGKCKVFTVDLQALKVCPFTNASALYYKTKLACHNYILYDLVSNEARYS